MLTTRSRALLALPAAASVLVLLAACSSSSDDTSTAPESTTNAQPADGQGGEMPGGGGVSGEIAAVSDALMQVQGDDGQTAVSWDDSTTITQTVSAALTDVTVGVCVTAVLGDDDLATSIAISQPTDGECTGGFGGGMGGGGQMPGGDSSGEMPDGMPTDMPSGMPDGEMPDGAPTDMAGGGGGGFGQFTSGLVTAVDGSTITVDAVAMGEDASTESTTITVGDSTTYTTSADADSSAITVGRCVVAQGDQDDSGQMTATSLTLSDATDGSCSTGFGGGGRPDGQGGSEGGSDA